jgi:uncharacterized membrane protein (UPF0136 family)
MELNTIISYGLSVLTAISAILSMQFKNIKYILITQITGNLLAAFSYFFLPEADAGFAVSIIAVIQSIVMFFYDRKKKTPHILITLSFIAAFLFFSLYQKTDNILNYLPAAAAVCFAIAITQTKANRFRIFGLINSTLWIIYDVCLPIPSANVLVHAGIAVSTVIGMIRLDGLFGIVKQKK